MGIGFGEEKEQEEKQGLEGLIKRAIEKKKALRICFPNIIIRIIPEEYNRRTGELSGSILTKVLGDQGEKLIKVPGVVNLHGIQIVELQSQEAVENDFQMVYPFQQYTGRQATVVLKKEYSQIDGIIVGNIGDYIFIKRGSRLCIVPQSEICYWEIKE